MRLLLSVFNYPTVAEAADQAAPYVTNDRIVVALITFLGTIGAAWMMFRGKTQDTANWLIVELRNETQAARENVKECAEEREKDRLVMTELRSRVAHLESRLDELE